MLNILITGMPKKLPKEMEKAVEHLKKCRNKEECLKEAYKILKRKFVGRKMYYLTHFWQVFQTNIDYIWNKRKVLNCNEANYLLKVLLVKSGHFNRRDIKNSWTMVWWISPHQYLHVNTGKKEVIVDLWGASNKVPFGKYAH
jgi:hypothetical protein